MCAVSYINEASIASPKTHSPEKRKEAAERRLLFVLMFHVKHPYNIILINAYKQIEKSGISVYNN